MKDKTIRVEISGYRATPGVTVRTGGGVVVTLNIQGAETLMYADEARALAKALKRAAKAAEKADRKAGVTY